MPWGILVASAHDLIAACAILRFLGYAGDYIDMRSPSSIDVSRAPFIEEHLRGRRLACAVTMAVRRSGPVHVGCAGVRDLTTGESVAPDTLFRLHSMSKPLTAVGLDLRNIPSA
jgi:CubicO group peptidase (beta-lactamase class C family)